jgi:hypothetical protein
MQLIFIWRIVMAYKSIISKEHFEYGVKNNVM